MADGGCLREPCSGVCGFHTPNGSKIAAMSGLFIRNRPLENTKPFKIGD
jgi:hypothetical protein